ncbi:UbiX family flavin prenyltransferase [Streptomyces sp. G-G2]|uniref:UbiX family flavin prenyltransferase n=1 Tax=Streptomyces sp. G-G2 TaxID=3046201 RepID=UPI0024BA4A0F|nr:UbiX family flavin prenyltransferase [Streptomyces sp. G-G2]MDJ0384570.1 UbiX family flavin prenyltransferase [Streptomyces sp. G-G2]
MRKDDGPAASPTRRPRLIVGITGASAPQLAVHLLTTLRALETVETHLVMSRAAHRTIELETGMRPADVAGLCDVSHPRGDIAAEIASGSCLTMGMAVVPCSMKTLAAISHGYSDDLLTRAADVCLKERRRLVLVTRETPLSLVHLRNMTAVTEAGAIVLPPVPAYYHRPASLDDLLAHVTGKILDQFGIHHEVFPRWRGVRPAAAASADPAVARHLAKDP